jgi:hypothetical protein
MRLLRKFLTLAPVERRLLVKATCLLAVVQLGLGRVPFTMLRRLVTRDARDRARLAGGPRGFAGLVVWAVTAASRRVPGRTTCLSRALTVQALLARSGYPSRLHVGVIRGKQGEVEGHAWVECEGRILIGGTASEIGQFTPLAAFDVETALRLQAAATLQEGR